MVIRGEKTSGGGEKTSGYLEGRSLLLAVVALNIANGVAFIEILALSAVLPVVSNHFNSSETIEFAATAQLIGACAGQCLLGYLSDLWSRRTMLLIALGLLVSTGLLCGSSFYISAPAFFTILRAVAGIGLGSISNLVNIAQNDIADEHRRLGLQGIQGISVAIGSIAGMLAGAALAVAGKWQVLYFLQAGLSLLAASGIWIFVPKQQKMAKNTLTGTLKTIDYIGSISFMGLAICGLLLLDKYDKFSRASNIILGSLTAACSVSFIASNFQNFPNARPIIPLRLWRNRTIAAIFGQNILFGATYYSFIYLTPVTLQAVRSISLVEAAALLVPYFIAHAISSTASARIIRNLKDKGYRSFSLVFYFAFSVWTLAMGLLAWDSVAQHGHVIIPIVMLVGLGTGSVFQNSVMAISAQVDQDDKAIAIGTRNVLRYFGGALGLAISSKMMSSLLKQHLPEDLEKRVHSSAFFDLRMDGLTAEEQKTVHHAYAKAIAKVFYVMAGMMSLCLVSTAFVQDKRKERIQDAEKDGAASSEETTTLKRAIIRILAATTAGASNAKDEQYELSSTSSSPSTSGKCTPRSQDSAVDMKTSIASSSSRRSIDSAAAKEGTADPAQTQ